MRGLTDRERRELLDLERLAARDEDVEASDEELSVLDDLLVQGRVSIRDVGEADVYEITPAGRLALRVCPTGGASP